MIPHAWKLMAEVEWHIVFWWVWPLVGHFQEVQHAKRKKKVECRRHRRLKTACRAHRGRLTWRYESKAKQSYMFACATSMLMTKASEAVRPQQSLEEPGIEPEHPWLQDGHSSSRACSLKKISTWIWGETEDLQTGWLPAACFQAFSPGACWDVCHPPKDPEHKWVYSERMDKHQFGWRQPAVPNNIISFPSRDLSGSFNRSTNQREAFRKSNSGSKQELQGSSGAPG